MSKKILAFDFETANLPPDNSSVAFPVELAMLLIDADKLAIETTFHRYIKLPATVEMSKEAQKTHGLTPKFLAENGVNFWEVSGGIQEWLAANGIMLPDGGPWDKDRANKLIPLGQNVVQFDLPILRKLMGGTASTVFTRSAIDTMLIAEFINTACRHAFGYDGMPFRHPTTGYPSSSLAAQMNGLDINPEGHHGAMFDVVTTFEIFKKHIENYGVDLKKSAAFTASGAILPEKPLY